MKFSSNIYFTLLLCWCIAGVFIFNIVEDFYLLFILIALILLSWIIVSYYYRQYLIPLVILVVSITFWWIYSSYHLTETSHNYSVIDSSSWLYIYYESQVKSVYKKSDYYNEYILELRHMWSEAISHRIYYIASFPKNFELKYWQYIGHSWRLNIIENFDNFEYKKYMLSKWIYFKTSSSSLTQISQKDKDIISYMSEQREKMLSTIYAIFPRDEAIFLWGILLWARENIPSDLKEDFNNSWLTHFIAVSWFNITICVIFASLLFWFLPPIVRVIVVSWVIVSFAVFVWLWAPVVRASIMWVLAYIFLQSWTGVKNITLLAFTALCMTLYSPLSINYDVSLHLSFLAVIGIIYTQWFFKKIFYFMPSTFAIREACVLTFAALSFSLPIMLFGFGQVSLLAPLANIAVTWTIPLAMLWWAITLILYGIFPALWFIVWFPTWILLKYDMLMVHFFWNIDSALFKLDTWEYSSYFLALYFLVLFYALSVFYLKQDRY